jgi:hypothetical protein
MVEANLQIEMSPLGDFLIFRSLKKFCIIIEYNGIFLFDFYFNQI